MSIVDKEQYLQRSQNEFHIIIDDPFDRGGNRLKGTVLQFSKLLSVYLKKLTAFNESTTQVLTPYSLLSSLIFFY